MWGATAVLEYSNVASSEDDTPQNQSALLFSLTARLLDVGLAFT